MPTPYPVSANVDTFMKSADQAAMRTNLGATTPGTNLFTAATVDAQVEILLGEVDVSSFATSGSGTTGDPWLGWDTAITWTAFTTYRFRSGYFEHDGATNFLKSGIRLLGDAGTYIRHAPALSTVGPAFTMDAGATSVWIQNVNVQSIIVIGKPFAITGTVTIGNGLTALVGSGTSFTTELPIGASITFDPGGSSARSYVITAVADNTHATIDRVATQAESGTPNGCRTTDGFYLRGVRNGVFDQCAAHDVGNAAIWTEACVTNSLRMFRCSYHEPHQSDEFQCRPRYGVVFTQSAARPEEWSSTWSVEEPVIEGMQVYGIWLTQYSYGNTIINGTSEGNPTPAIGVLVESNYNTIIGLDVEGNATGFDFRVSGSYNTFINCICHNDFNVIWNNSLTPIAYASENTIIGLTANSLTLDSSSNTTRYLGGGNVVTLTDGTTNDSTLNLKLAPSYLDKRSYLGVVKKSPTSLTSSGGAVAALNGLYYNVARVTSGENTTIANPTNATNGAEIDYIITNTKGSLMTLAFGTDFAGSTTIALPTNINTGRTIFLRFRYDTALSNKWVCILLGGNATFEEQRVVNGSNYLSLTPSGVVSYYNNALGVAFQLHGQDPIVSNGAALQLGALGAVTWQSTNRVDTGTPDLLLWRKAAATLQLGQDAAGTTAQMLTAANRIASDGVGANLTIAPGNGQGAAGGSLILGTYDTRATGVIGVLQSLITMTSAAEIGFFGVTPISQQGSVTAPGGSINTGSDLVDIASIQAAVSDLQTFASTIKSILTAYGLTA